MSILCDQSIFDLCVMPPKRFDPIAYEALRAYALAQYGQHLYHGGDQPCQTDFEKLRAHAMFHWTEEEIQNWRPMIAPFTQGQIRTIGARNQQEPGQLDLIPFEQLERHAKTPIISRGLTSYGYDVSLAPEFKVFTNINSAYIDPKRIDPKCFVDVMATLDEDTGEQYVMMPPNSYLLGRTIERFHIPRDIMVLCVGKSTYARSGGIVNVTPIEPDFRGNVVIEISNSTNLPARVYANEGIAQFMFLRGDAPCTVSYGDRGGKYQDQSGITLPRA